MGGIGAPAAIYWVDEPAAIDIVDGICICRVRTGETIIEMRATVATLLSSIANGARAYTNIMQPKDAQIIQIGKKRPRRH